MRKFMFLSATALVVAASPLAAQSAAAPAAKISAADFAAMPEFTKPKLSPDGHRIAARSVTDENTIIVVLDADHPEKALRTIPIPCRTP